MFHKEWKYYIVDLKIFTLIPNTSMNKILFIFTMLFILSEICFAQSRKLGFAKSYSDIGFSGGIYTNAKGSALSNGTVYSVDYGQYAHNGIGCRGGVNYIDALDNNISAVQIPLSFAWRIPTPTRRRTLIEATDDFLYGLAQPPTPNYQNVVISLFSFRAEFNIGVTPSYIIGNGYYNEQWSSVYGTFSEGVLVRGRFGLSLDAGARFSVRIWRFNIIVNPTYHYWLTNNFTAKSTLPISQPSKSYVSFKFGLSYAF